MWVNRTSAWVSVLISPRGLHPPTSSSSVCCVSSLHSTRWRWSLFSSHLNACVCGLQLNQFQHVGEQGLYWYISWDGSCETPGSRVLFFSRFMSWDGLVLHLVTWFSVGSFISWELVMEWSLDNGINHCRGGGNQRARSTTDQWPWSRCWSSEPELLLVALTTVLPVGHFSDQMVEMKSEMNRDTSRPCSH